MFCASVHVHLDCALVTNYTKDATPPELVAFSVYSNGRLMLYFSEPVLSSTFNVTGLTLEVRPSVVYPSNTYTTNPSFLPSLRCNALIRPFALLIFVLDNRMPVVPPTGSPVEHLWRTPGTIWC